MFVVLLQGCVCVSPWALVARVSDLYLPQGDRERCGVTFRLHQVPMETGGEQEGEGGGVQRDGARCRPRGGAFLRTSSLEPSRSRGELQGAGRMERETEGGMEGRRMDG